MGGLLQLFWGRDGDFQDLDKCPVWGLLWLASELSWRLKLCHLAYANVFQWAHNDTQSLLEVGSSAISDLADCNQFMSCPQPLCYFLKVVSSRFKMQDDPVWIPTSSSVMNLLSQPTMRGLSSLLSCPDQFTHRKCFWWFLNQYFLNMDWLGSFYLWEFESHRSILDLFFFQLPLWWSLWEVS